MTSIARDIYNHLANQRTERLNRQARIVGDGADGAWEDYGDVSLNEAAIAEAIAWFSCGAKVGVTDFRPVQVEVRDEANPDITWKLTVEREVSYRVRGLRGGE